MTDVARTVEPIQNETEPRKSLFTVLNEQVSLSLSLSLRDKLTF